MAVSSIVNFFHVWKLMIIYTTIIIMIIVVLIISWHYRHNTSKFIWNPAPLVRGFWLSILGTFYRNPTTKILLELEKLLNSLSDDVPIILIIGPKDVVKNYVFEFGDDNICWYFIRNKIYFYVNNLDQLEFIVNFLKSLKDTRCINSIVLKLAYEENIPKDKLDYIRLTTGYRLPIYLVFMNLDWTIYIHENLDEEILGFLRTEDKSIYEEYESFCNIMNHKLIIKDKYSIEFNAKYSSYINNIILTTEELMRVQDYNFRGVFFSLSSNKLPNVLEDNNYVPNTFFINYLQKIVEEEVFLGAPLQGLVIIPRYQHLHRWIIGIIICLCFFHLLIQYKNITAFHTRYNNFILNVEDMIVDLNEKTNIERKNYITYEILSRLGEIDLSNMYSKYLPHRYMLKNMYEDLCEIEDLLSFSSFKHINTVNNNDYYENFSNFYEYINRVMEMEAHIFSYQKTYRFGIYTKRSDTSIENAKLSFQFSLKEVHRNAMALYKKFATSVAYHPIKITFQQFDEAFNDFMSRRIYTIDGIKNIINLYNKLMSFTTDKSIVENLIKINSLSKKLKSSIIFNSHMSEEIAKQLDEYVKTFMYEVAHLEQKYIGPIFMLDINTRMLHFNEDVVNIINDLKNFINEPIMNNYTYNNIRDLYTNFSYWNINNLSHIISEDINENVLNNTIQKYSPKLRNILLFVSKKNNAKFIFNKILQNRITKTFDGINDMKNFHDSLPNLIVLLDYFQNINDMETYNSMINIIKNDIDHISDYIEVEINKNIFFDITTRTLTLKQNFYEDIFFTNNLNIIKINLEENIKQIHFIVDNFINDLFNICENKHFSMLKNKNWRRYMSISKELCLYNQGKDSAFRRFINFIIDLKDFKFYGDQNLLQLTDINDNIIDNNINLLKEKLRYICHQNTRKYLEENYKKFRIVFKEFLTYYPFNVHSKHLIKTNTFINFINDHKDKIKIFQNINTSEFDLYEQNILKKLNFYSENIFNNYKGDFIRLKCDFLFKQPPTDNFLQPIITVIVNNVKYDITKPLEKSIDIYFHQELIIEIPLHVNNPKTHIKFKQITHHDYTISMNGHHLEMKFHNFWCFYRFLMHHKKDIHDDVVVFTIHLPLSNTHLHIHMTFDKNLFFNLPI